jgi:prepilin-type N-terminal cleavage/methylation domain-containing protein
MYNKRAYTLIELAMVLVIMAMLVTATLKGKNIIGQGRAKGILIEISKLRSYTEEFKVSYNLSLPGDMHNAYDYLVDCGANLNVPGGCNGNGNGYIGYAQYDNNYEESYKFWLHLQRAGLLDQMLSGEANLTAPYADKLNMYNSKAIRDAIYYPHFPYEMQKGQFYSTDYQSSNIFILARPSTETILPSDKALNPLIAYNIDLKIDDGKPRSGKIKAYNYYHKTNGYHGSTPGNISGTECDSLGNTSGHSDKILREAFYEISISSEECILFIDF